MNCAVIGPDGFIGRNFVNHLQDNCNLTQIRKETDISSLTQQFDYVFFCAGNSAAFKTADNPKWCLEKNIFDLHEYLTGLNYDKFLHLSSTSVYPSDMNEKKEDSRLDPRELSLYGAHKLLSEKYVMDYASNWIILRVAYLYGSGLWKNLFYDIRSGHRELYLDKESYLAALNVDHLVEAALSVMEAANNETFNVGSSHAVQVKEIVDLIPGTFEFKNDRYIDQRGISLQKLQEYWQDPISRDEYLENIRQFIRRGD